MASSTVVHSSPYLWGYLGAASSLVFSGFGAAIGTYKAAQGIAEADNKKKFVTKQPPAELESFTNNPENSEFDDNSWKYPEEDSFNPAGYKLFIPIIIAGVLAIYGLIYSVIALQGIDSDYSPAEGFSTFGAGLAVGLSCLASGIAIGIVSKTMIPKLGDSNKKFIGFVLILVYCEAIGLYGLIVSLIAQSSGDMESVETY